MANETCPHCGAERRYNERYDCGTWLAGVVGNNEVRAGICWDRQLATVTAERDELRRRINEAGECIDQFRGAVWAYGSKSERDELEKLTRLVRDDQPEEAVT